MSAKNRNLLLHIPLMLGVVGLLGCDSKEPEQTEQEVTPSNATPSSVAQQADTSGGADYPVEVYFGNLHVHTKWSFDAYINGSVSDPDDAYRWAKGESIPGGGNGTPLQIKVPLDWYVVSDHSEYLGALPLMGDPSSELSKHPLAAAISGDDAVASFNAYTEILDGISNRRKDPVLGDPELAKTVWNELVSIADKHYEPGKFTTMAGFEWTSNPGWRNLHRIVFFKDTKNLPNVPFSAIDSDAPEDLWKWMDEQREKGAEVLAIPHNGNASDGLMFPVDKTYGGSELNLEYAQTRMKNEPVYEISQIKGTSETHPLLSPNDEFSGFEIWDYTLSATATPPEHKRGGYVRDALTRGLVLESAGKGNPFKYGFIGDSDTHNSAATIEEDNYSGKFGFENDPKHRLDGPPGVSQAAARQVREFSSAGVAGVWAKENTREGIFEAIKRKETFATSGVRMKVRFFGSFDYSSGMLDSSDWVTTAYDTGVPMGGDLKGAGADAPTFIVFAAKEVDGANLDRVQIIKGWEQDGQTFEKIYDVALSDGRVVDNDGKVPSVGNTVDPATATYSNSIGDAQLSVVWTDPDFDKSQHAFYYARVLEIPTPRWSTYDAVTLGVPLKEGLPVSIQERAWSSPIWYTP